MRKLFFLSLLPFSFIACTSVKNVNTATTTPTLKYINSIEIPFNTEFKNTVVGGLSSIDYDATKDQYYFVCDDRSTYNDARFYTASISMPSNQIEGITFKDVVTLKNEKGESYGNWEKVPNSSIDPEELRYNPKTKTVVWSSEGARVVAKDFSVIQDPAIQNANLDGSYLSSYNLPSNLEMQKIEKGPRSNGVLEGITFDKNYSTLYANVEEPLYEDGNKATTTAGGLIRIYQFDVKSKKNTAQYGYLLDPIEHEPNPKNSFAVNGVSSIQYYRKNQLLVVERSYSVGRQACTIKVYLCDLTKATNVTGETSLKNEKIKLATKKLVLNMDDLGIFTDNIEGVTFGPKLANGKQSLLFVSDNNFSDQQKSQLLLFEIE
ncbi:hypothetical protein FFWV33_00490 [Flavobacterium faecale]|uniref:Phytase-like domain-containing protein n=1 Tax=Flavobacterium faecale TaxID=1355330 RepID=A0A2S1L8P6_9FLAO|nr:esterase-like activity of phytase family protein [Flavobacterium faecale]AWG20101.1 hypothetical protein FFWV33_00490 [Flavobacterium faecale]